MLKFIFCFEQSVAKMPNKVVFLLGFDANIVLTVWFCCNMSRSRLVIFSGKTVAIQSGTFYD